MSPAFCFLFKSMKDGCTCISLCLSLFLCVCLCLPLSLSVCLYISVSPLIRLYWPSLLTPLSLLLSFRIIGMNCHAHLRTYFFLCKAILIELYHVRHSRVWWRCHHLCVLVLSQVCEERVPQSRCSRRLGDRVSCISCHRPAAPRHALFLCSALLFLTLKLKKNQKTK